MSAPGRAELGRSFSGSACLRHSQPPAGFSLIAEQSCPTLPRGLPKTRPGPHPPPSSFAMFGVGEMLLIVVAGAWIFGARLLPVLTPLPPATQPRTQTLTRRPFLFLYSCHRAPGPSPHRTHGGEPHWPGHRVGLPDPGPPLPVRRGDGDHQGEGKPSV